MIHVESHFVADLAHSCPPLRGDIEELGSAGHNIVEPLGTLRDSICTMFCPFSLPELFHLEREPAPQKPHNLGPTQPMRLLPPQHLGQCPSPPDQFLDEVLGPPLAKRGPPSEPRLVADGVASCPKKIGSVRPEAARR